MPAPKGAPTGPPDDTPVAPAAAADTPPASETPPVEPLPGRLAPGPAEYTATFESVYLSVPLTARPAVDEHPATVFDWLDGAPDDGRWRPTTSKPNKLPDNTVPADVKEG